MQNNAQPIVRNMWKHEFGVNHETYFNMVNINKTYFLIYGYLVTDGDKYKLYDSKDAYNKNPEAGEYFLISWNGEFPYTGNQDVNIRCRLEDTYKIKECTYVK